MLLIFIDTNENGVDNVCKWLDYLDIKYNLIYENDLIEFKYTSLHSNEFTFKINNINFDSSTIKGIWFRKTPFNLSETVSTLITNNSVLDSVIKTYVNLELNTLSEYLNIICHENFKTIGSSKTLYANKLIQLFYAKKVGLKIPQSEIITDLNDFYLKFGNSNTITKGIYDTFLFNTGTYVGSSKISQVNVNDISMWNTKNVIPSLFQLYIEKHFEIRSFYFKNKFYSMAIFSQSNEKTRIDFRNYDMNKPNRMVPFLLPEEIEAKLREILDYLSLDTGSFDLIYGLDGEYYFLEVNPVGQFDFLSGMCNYNIEKIISNYFNNE